MAIEEKTYASMPSCPDAAATLVVRLGYDGTEFSGFALQEGHSRIRTVAGELQRALRTLLHREPAVTCAGRTDAGVHARSQYVSVPLNETETRDLDARRMIRSLNALLPDDIQVTALYRGAPGFSARFDACARQYRYRIVAGPAPALFNARWSWWLHLSSPDGLDIAAMETSACALIGEHDFKSFCKSESAQDKPTHRFIESIVFSDETALGERMLAIDVTGNAFLHSMVRTIVGTLVEVGCGRRDPSWVSEVLAACDRRAAGPTAPPQGLTLWDVRYAQRALEPW